MSKSRPSEHETFKNKLLDDVLGQGNADKVPMEKVVMLLWAFRDDPSVVTFMARFVSKYAGSRHVFDGIEFYLPQVAHMIIHLEVEWDDAILERFALVIAQQSMHFALQFNWILQGALEDYWPELTNGAPNPDYQPELYVRCWKLLKNVERVVVYGKPRAAELQRLYEQGKITKNEMNILELADRRFNALQITTTVESTASPTESAVPLDGVLDVKVPIIEAPAKHDEPAPPPKEGTWASRFCIMEKQVITCYIEKSGMRTLDRGMSLEKAQVMAPESSTHIILIKTPNYEFRLRPSSEQEANLWYRRLQEECQPSALFSTGGSTHGTAPTEGVAPLTDAALKKDLTAAQLDRYEFFHHERSFVYDLTKVAEDLRMEPREQRKALAPGYVEAMEIPATVYLPLCNSTDLWRRVSESLSKDTRVFNTKERCPVIMHFLTRRGEMVKTGVLMDPNLDVAEFMHAHVEVKEEIEAVPEEDENVDVVTGEGGMELVKGAKRADDPNPADDDDDDEDHFQDTSQTLDDSHMQESTHGGSVVWNEDEKEGKGGRMQKFLKESVVSVPAKLAKKLPKMDSRRGISVLDRQTEVQPLVPILEGTRGPQAAEEFDNASVGGSVVSVERSSILVKDQMVLGDLGHGSIDVESINKAKVFVAGGQLWAEKSAAMLEEAKQTLSEEPGQVEISSCLAKSNDDLRQEVFVMQMIHYYKSVFAQAKLPLWLKTYRILSTSSSTGLLEFLTDATSIDGLKKSEGFPKEGGLRKYFEMVYGSPDKESFKAAQRNFMQSLAGYAVVSYLLGLKDRHNGNIMIDTRGHLIFIDFGFALGMAPGHEFSFERAPFKLTKEYVEVMGGTRDPCFKEFERLFVAGFEEARKHYQIALGLVEIMMFKSRYPCFSGKRYGGGKALTRFEKKLMLDVPDDKVKKKALKLIRRSKQHFGTYLYDLFQKVSNGYEI